MHAYPFEKNVYNYLAVVLVYGRNSPHVRMFDHFSLPTFNNDGLEVFEHSAVEDGNNLNTQRHMNLDDERTIQTSHIERASGISRIVSYIDKDKGIFISDSLFSDEEFASFGHDWSSQTESKIRYLGMLIEALHKKSVPDMLLSVNDYPNITKMIFEEPRRLENEDK